MRIVFITEFYTSGMGYTENCLPKAVAALGHEVHLIASNLNIYGNSPDYASVYERFLGPPEQECGVREVDGYRLHRLPHRLVGGYVRIRGLVSTVARLAPDIVQAGSAAGINVFLLAAGRFLLKGRLFTECHQHMSVVKPYLKNGTHLSLRRAAFLATRTLPGWLAARATEKCYAIAPDCAEVAHRLYGVPWSKIVLSPLGSDTSLFRPAQTAEELAARKAARRRFGFEEDEVVCVYTGRFSAGKNPLLLARAVAALRESGLPYRALFVGDGPQENDIRSRAGCAVEPFVRHSELPLLYRAADVGVWPFQESMSMLDAAACGLPLVVSDRMGEPERVNGGGLVYREGDQADLGRVLRELGSAELRRRLGRAGAERVLQDHSWERIAARRLQDYEASIAQAHRKGTR
jgi:glycosyltransferase involved in cell wall biosynthesis